VGDRRYTVREIDALRQAVTNMWLYGSYNLVGSGCSRVYVEQEKTRCVEELVRTHMLAGHTAEDLYASERKQADARKMSDDAGDAK